MIDMNFEEDVTKILSNVVPECFDNLLVRLSDEKSTELINKFGSKTRLVHMFSATMNDKLKVLADNIFGH